MPIGAYASFAAEVQLGPVLHTPIVQRGPQPDFVTAPWEVPAIDAISILFEADWLASSG
jgi:hypothetical protein